MTGRLTMWGAQQLLTTYFTQRTTPPPTFYLALIRAIPPTPYMDGTELDEPDTPDYARVAITNDLANWSNDSQPQEISNILPQQFITATNDWGRIGYWALCDSLVDGNNFIVGDLENPVMIMTGDQATFEEGDLSATLGPFFLQDDDS
jgi:hypothetical protein